MKTIHNGSEAERADFLRNEGILIALFVDGLIQSLSLQKEGGVTVVGWSLGNIYTIAMRASINDLPDNTKQRLKEYTRGFIVLGLSLRCSRYTKYIFIHRVVIDPPAHALGFPIPPGGYTPLGDHDIPDEARGPAFAKWVSSYYKHGDLSSQVLSQLNQREGDTSKKPTTDTIPLEELLTITDFGPAAKCETFIVESQQFLSTFMNQTTKALFDPQIRDAWGEHLVWFVYCEASFWLAIYAAWNLKKEDKTSSVNFKSIPDANHFVRIFFLFFYSFKSHYFMIDNVGRTGAIHVIAYQFEAPQLFLSRTFFKSRKLLVNLM